MRELPKHDPLLTPAEVGALLAVDTKTVSRWAKTGKIPADEMTFTPGGHRRYKESYIRSLLPPRGGEPS